MRKISVVLRREIRRNDVYLSLAGGRKTMSAAMALVGQLYGVRRSCTFSSTPTSRRMA